MRDVTIYTVRSCPYCRRAKQLLEDRRIPYREVDLTDQPGFREDLHRKTGGWTVPQVVIGDRPVGGYQELERLHRRGELERLLSD